ncbi:MAG: GNAT family N-acetyltransferase [Brumimicrobium sp.]
MEINLIADRKNIRRAKPGDEVQIINLIKELAEYENALNEVVNTPEQLAIDLFEDKICSCFVYENNLEIIGIAIYYISYSTWKGRSLYLEDMYIKEEFRRNGIGGLMFDVLVEEAKAIGAKRLDWQVLDWNNPAIDFYKKIGAELSQEWISGRLRFD